MITGWIALAHRTKAKIHNDLVDYEALSEDEKRKDSSVGAR